MKYLIEVIWNRDFNYSSFGDPKNSLIEAKKYGQSLLESGDGARVKEFRVLNQDGEVVYPISKTLKDFSPMVYVCNFCGKKELGKPYGYLKNPSKHLDHKVALRPKGWDWNIVPIKFTDSWSCGCHVFK